MATKQRWEVGSAVKVGGRELFVTGTLPPRKRGEAGRYVLETLDRSKAYEWVPFRGLTLVRGELVRAKRRRRSRAKVATTAKPQMVAKGSLFTRLLARFGKRVKPPSNKTISRPPGEAIKGQPRAQ